MAKTALKKQARITSKGQLTLPHAVRKAMGVVPGDTVVFAQDSVGFRVDPVRTKSPFGKYRGIGNSSAGSGRKSVIRAVRKLRGR
jgi:AbrB family looped-hinge helix DNA binding protein